MNVSQNWNQNLNAYGEYRMQINYHFYFCSYSMGIRPIEIETHTLKISKLLCVICCVSNGKREEKPELSSIQKKIEKKIVERKMYFVIIQSSNGIGKMSVCTLYNQSSRNSAKVRINKVQRNLHTRNLYYIITIN